MDMVKVMLGLIRASRESDWVLHLASIRAMIPWCFAYDKLNYACYLPYYYAQMSRLAIDHPDVHEQFMQGQGFSVQLGRNNPFGRIPVDQTIEETINKDTEVVWGSRRRPGIGGGSSHVTGSAILLAYEHTEHNVLTFDSSLTLIFGGFIFCVLSPEDFQTAVPKVRNLAMPR